MTIYNRIEDVEVNYFPQNDEMEDEYKALCAVGGCKKFATRWVRYHVAHYDDPDRAQDHTKAIGYDLIEGGYCLDDTRKICWEGGVQPNELYPEWHKMNERSTMEQRNHVGDFIEWLRYTNREIFTLVPAGNNGEPEYIFSFSGKPATEEDYRAYLKRDPIESAKDIHSGVMRNPQYAEWEDRWVPSGLSTQDLIAEFFELDKEALNRDQNNALEDHRMIVQLRAEREEEYAQAKTSQ
jgi:hypothetical protein